MAAGRGRTKSTSGASGKRSAARGTAGDPPRDQSDGRQASAAGTRSSRARSPRQREQQHPRNPLPKQHLEKPGLESELEPKPQYEAPSYRAAGKLRGKTALITGGDSGIGRAVAVLYAKEGADVAIVHLPEELEDAEETRRAVQGEGRRCVLIAGDL